MAKKNYDELFKLLLIGDSAVGKTCLLFRYVDDSYSPTFISTIGIDFKIKTVEVEGKKIKLQIWDTAGQERFHTITMSYYRGAMGIMLVYDLTNRRSYENVHKWLSNIQLNATENVERILIANKLDLEDKRVIPHEMGQEIANVNKIPFVEVSAKTGDNVELAFTTLTTNILKSRPASSGSADGTGHHQQGGNNRFDNRNRLYDPRYSNKGDTSSKQHFGNCCS